MSQTTTPPNAPAASAADVFAIAVKALRNPCGPFPGTADSLESVVAELLTREAALVAERDAALRRANIAEARVKGWEATVVITNLPTRIWPVEGWGPGEGETVAVPELTPKKLTAILDRLKAADAIADERDALAAEVGALRLDAERYRVYRLYKTSGSWPRFRGQEPGLCAWSGTSLGREYTGEVIDEMMDRLLAGEYTRPIVDAAIAFARTSTARAEAGHG